jgi:hypothetical protein
MNAATKPSRRVDVGDGSAVSAVRTKVRTGCGGVPVRDSTQCGSMRSRNAVRPRPESGARSASTSAARLRSGVACRAQVLATGQQFGDADIAEDRPRCAAGRLSLMVLIAVAQPGAPWDRW